MPAAQTSSNVHHVQEAAIDSGLRWPASAIWHAGDPAVRTITLQDLRMALRKGYDDFTALPTHAIFLVLVYPVIGFILARMAFGYNMLHLVFPTAAGFALLGPIAALGLYELSRRREQGLHPTASDALAVVHAKSFASILALALLLLAIFSLWIVTADALYRTTFGSAPPPTVGAFVDQVVSTSRGYDLMLTGTIIGFVFAVVVLMISAVSFPLLLDRDIGAAAAMRTSIRAFVENPVTMSAWGLIVAVALLLGSLPLFIGLAFVVPVLGHATWHLYRLVVER